MNPEFLLMDFTRMKKSRVSFCLILVLLVLCWACGCSSGVQAPEQRERESSISPAAVKITPSMDLYPPRVHCGEFRDPVPLPSTVNTAGAEDSPFIFPGRQELYFFFTPDPSIPPERQLLDGVTGIWVSRFSGDWQKPERVVLQDTGKLALDGCAFVQDETLWFCSAREGYTGLHWFTATWDGVAWNHWENHDFAAGYEVGELHFNGDELYYHSARAGGMGGTDIWVTRRIGSSWQTPENVAAVNTAADEGQPFLTTDGSQLWFNREYLGSPAIYRSIRTNGVWQEPQLIMSSFAGEPTLDGEGNVYFVHHFFKDGRMLEADIYVAYRS